MNSIFMCIVFAALYKDGLAEKKAFCTEESTNEKSPVIWPYTIVGSKKVESTPLCLSESLELVSRTCETTGWVPKHENIPQCSLTMTRHLKERCPPGFGEVWEEDEEIKFCYQLNKVSSWSYPCFNSGSGLTVFDLENGDLQDLINTLVFEEKKYVWLPAKRIVPFGPIVWTIPGEKWGQQVEFGEEIIATRLPVTQNCLLLDLDKHTVKTDNCSYQYPSLCITEKEHLLPLHCPFGYEASKSGLNNGLCYGLEIVENSLSWDRFIESRCPQPMVIKNEDENYLVNELSEEYGFDMDDMCWIGLMRKENNFYWYPNLSVAYVNWDSQTNFNQKANKGAMNDKYNWLLLNEDKRLKCMACEINVMCDEVDLLLQDNHDDTIQLTIYNHKNLWRVEDDDIGVQCFSNAQGFEKKVRIVNIPYRKANLHYRKKGSGCHMEKIVYNINRINDQTGEYWCEGHHSKNFSLITSQKLLLPSKSSSYHMFVLKVKINKVCDDFSTCNPDWNSEAKHMEKLLKAKNVKIMNVESINSNFTASLTAHAKLKLISRECEMVYCKIILTFNSFLNVCRLRLSKNTSYEFISLKSTEFCLPENEFEMFGKLSWELTRIGENTAPREFCMQSNGLPVTRQCLGSFLNGGQWGQVQGNCSENFEPTNRTTYLYSIAKGRTDISTTSSFLVHDLISLLDNKGDLIPADIYFLAMSLKTIVELSNANSSLIDLGDSLNIATAINSIMDIQESYLNLAQTMNSSNMLLESIDLILSKIAINEDDIHFEDYGIDLAVMPQFIIQISNPYVNNISGLAIARKPGYNSTSFRDHEIIQLTTNTTVQDVLAIPNLEAATWMTQELLDSMKYSNRSIRNDTYSTILYPKIIIEIFYSDIVFQETKKQKDQVNSRIISVTVPGFESDLPLALPLIYRRLDDNTPDDRICAYWDFKPYYTSFGQWSKKGCFYSASHGDLDECACFHLTHFAQLVLGHKGSTDSSGEIIILYYHRRALNAITLVGCSLSMVGVAGIGATALLFPAWRQKAGSKVLLQLSAAIALQSIMMMSQDFLHESDLHCIALGVMLHYSVLAAFTWMLLTALLQFARYVRVLGVQRPARFMVKFSLLGWGLPILPVAILLIIDQNAYLPPATMPDTPNKTANVTLEPQRDPSAFCYPQGLALYLTVLLPIACIVITNLVVFVMVVRSITRGPDGKRRTADPELVISQLRLSILLFFLLGLSWIFGLLATTGGMILFSYLFCLTATLQGFVLFVYFVVCDPATRILWVSLVREKSKISKTLSTELSS